MKRRSWTLGLRALDLTARHLICVGVVLCPVAAALRADPDPSWVSAVAEAEVATVPEEMTERTLAEGEDRAPVGPITLVEAQGLALRQSPELASAAWEVRTRQGRAAQAGMRPNPELEFEMEDFAGSGELSGTSAAESTLALSQTIETRGKRPKRRRAAELDTEVARSEYQLARRRVLSDVVIAFAGVLAAQQRVALSEELVQVADASGAAAGRLVEAGATPAVERTRANVEAGIARIELASARRGLEAARAQLAATWGAEVATFDRAVGELGQVEAPESLEALRGRLAENPLLQRWEREVVRRESVVELEDAQSMPNLVARAGVRRLGEPDENAFVASLSMPFPIVDRNQGSREAARSDVRRATYERRTAEVLLASQLTAAYQELLARYGEVTELRSTILPSAQESFEGVRRGFQQGLFRNLDVLDAQRRLFELRIREIEALRSYHLARAVIDQLAPPGRGNP